jgi:hypothetical protein
LGPHSWDGGLSATNVFWAVELPEGSAHTDLDDGSARLHARNICVLDAFTVLNSVAGIARPVNQVRGIINALDIEWRANGTPKQQCMNQPANRMSGTFVENMARISVTATTPKTDVTALSNGHGFRFVSDPAETSVSHFAQIGQEQNGSFYSPLTCPI